MKFLILIIFFSLLNPKAFELKFEGFFEIKSNSFKIDILGNIYTIENQTLIKYNENGEKIKEYSNKYLGKIYSFDVSDPFKILVFFKEFNQILFLDNYLTEIRSPVKLDDLKMDQVEIACSSVQGGFWVFNNQSQQLVYFDKNLQKQQESVSLNSILRSANKPTFLTEKNDLLYMYIPENGIFVFDKYGAYFKTLNLETTNDFQVTDGKICYLQNNSIYKYDMKYLFTTNLDLPDSLKPCKASCLVKEKLYLLRGNKISIYKISERE